MLALRQGCVKHRELNELRSAQSHSNKMSAAIGFHDSMTLRRGANTCVTWSSTPCVNEQLTHNFKNSWLSWLFSKCLKREPSGIKSVSAVFTDLLASPMDQVSTCGVQEFLFQLSCNVHLVVESSALCLLFRLVRYHEISRDKVYIGRAVFFAKKVGQSKAKPNLSLLGFHFNQVWYRAFYHNINVKCCPVRIAALMLAYIAFSGWFFESMNSEVSVSKCLEDVSFKTVRKKLGNIIREHTSVSSRTSEAKVVLLALADG